MSQINAHLSYNSGTVDYDYSLVKIDPPINFAQNSHIRPACLPENTNTGSEPDSGQVGKTATVAGNYMVNASLRKGQGSALQ